MGTRKSVQAASKRLGSGNKFPTNGYGSAGSWVSPAEAFQTTDSGRSQRPESPAPMSALRGTSARSPDIQPHQAAGEVVAKSNVVPMTPFGGYSNEWIAEVCCVSPKTVRDWRFGRKKPSLQALKLFRLHAERRVLDEGFKGWLVNKGTLVDPEGNILTQGQLRSYYLKLSYLSSLCETNGPEFLREYWRLLEQNVG